jgi:hypothetical protein
VNKRDVQLLRAWHLWSDIWLSSSVLLLLVAFAGMLFCLSSFINPTRHAWFEANGFWLVIAIHGFYVPLFWQIYCGHRMSKAKSAVDQCAEQTAREFEA